MSTISEAIALEIIAGNGQYKDDPPVVKVVTYDNQWGGKSWAIVYPGQDPMRYERSPACSNVQTIWPVK